MNLFISWSGERSRKFAIELKDWLCNVIHYLQPWMSEIDILKGKRWGHEIGKKLSDYKIGILCVTPENQESPWLHFEAGAISKTIDDSKVCPILLGLQSSDLKNSPLAQFQSTTFTRDDMFKLVKSLNEELGTSKLDPSRLNTSFEKYWPDLEASVKKISKIGIESTGLPNVIKAFSGQGFPNPAVGRIVCFKEGFESHTLYNTICSLAKERLYIFGRKNRKIFDKEHWDFINKLPGMISQGFDFRCLFLDPYAPSHIIKEAHEDSNFPEQLKASIKQAVATLSKFDIDPDDVCRAYQCHRTTFSIVVDNVVLFTPVEYSESGKVKRLTKTRFEAIDARLPFGEELVQRFSTTWNCGNLLSAILAKWEL